MPIRMETLAGNKNWRPPKRKKGAPAHDPRPADTYRGARRNYGRGDSMALGLKEQREMEGISRRELDRRRERALAKQRGLA